MSRTGDPVNRNTAGWRRLVVRIVLAAVLVVIASVGYVFYSISSAEKKARSFCDEIEIGSDIGAAVARAGEKGIAYGSGSGYAFYFPTVTVFDRAVCGVSVNADGKVISKRSQMEYD